MSKLDRLADEVSAEFHRDEAREALWPSQGAGVPVPVKGVYKPNYRSPAFCSVTTGQPTELAEQFGLVQWVRWWSHQRELAGGVAVRFFAVPNGGKRDVTEAAMKLMEGLVKGVPDLWFPQRRRGYSGLVVEMKRAVEPGLSVSLWGGVGGWAGEVPTVPGKRWQGGVVSPEQKEWLESLCAEGYFAVVCHGMQEAKAVVEWYYS